MAAKDDAATVRHWLLGRRDSAVRLERYAVRAGWTKARFNAAMERALRYELIEYDRKTDSWGAARTRMFKNAGEERAYRIQDPDEPLEALLDVRRPDRWVASDEEYETQPEGVSCCRTIADLMAYAREYGMSELSGSQLVELTGEIIGRDRDHRAVRMRVKSARVIGSGERLLSAAHRGIRPGLRSR